jgi:hypothetical protein
MPNVLVEKGQNMEAGKDRVDEFKETGKVPPTKWKY